MEIQISIPLEVYTIEQACKKLKTSNSRKAFYANHVNIPDGIRLTFINNKVRITSIELARYLDSHTEKAK